MTPEYTIYALWVAWFVSWAVAMVWSSRPVRRDAIGAELFFRFLFYVGMILLFAFPNHYYAQTQLWHFDDALNWILAALAAAGLSFIWWARAGERLEQQRRAGVLAESQRDIEERIARRQRDEQREAEESMARQRRAHSLAEEQRETQEQAALLVQRRAQADAERQRQRIGSPTLTFPLRSPSS
jgi:signal transduction histidine kinase